MLTAVLAPRALVVVALSNKIEDCSNAAPSVGQASCNRQKQQAELTPALRALLVPFLQNRGTACMQYTGCMMHPHLNHASLQWLKGSVKLQFEHLIR